MLSEQFVWASHCSGNYPSAVLVWCLQLSPHFPQPSNPVSNTEVRAQAQSFLKNILDISLLSHPSVGRSRWLSMSSQGVSGQSGLYRENPSNNSNKPQPKTKQTKAKTAQRGKQEVTPAFWHKQKATRSALVEGRGLAGE